MKVWRSKMFVTLKVLMRQDVTTQVPSYLQFVGTNSSTICLVLSHIHKANCTTNGMSSFMIGTSTEVMNLCMTGM